MMGRPERRRAPRVNKQLALKITEAGGELKAETSNLSAIGTYCTLDRFIPPMTKLQLQLEIPDGARRTSVRCEGVVVRLEPIVSNPEHGQYQMAIFFTKLSERGRSAIERFVQHHLSSTSAPD